MSHSGSLLAFVIFVGALIPIQSGLNATLGKQLAHPLWAALVNFGVGGVALAGIAAVLRVSWPSVGQVAKAPWWSWCGGLLGATLVVAAVLAAPRLGAALLVAGLIAGQLCSSVVLDHFGWVGYAVHALSWTRVAGLALLGAGVALVRMG